MSGLNYLKLGSTLRNNCNSTQLDDATKCHNAFKNFWGELWRPSGSLYQILNCCLKTFSVWKSLKSVVRERVKKSLKKREPLFFPGYDKQKETMQSTIRFFIKKFRHGTPRFSKQGMESRYKEPPVPTVWCFTLSSAISWWPVHLSMLSWSSFYQYSTKYSFQATGCFQK